MELVTFETSDGLSLDGAWYPNNERNFGAIILHGKGQNFYSAIGRWLAPYLSTLGISSLAMNMRDHDHRELSDVEFADNDITAAVDYLREKGIEKFLLVANSYGSNKAVLYLSNEHIKDRMIGLVLLSAGGSKTDSPDLWKKVLENLRGITVPLLVIQAGADEFVGQPREAGMELIHASLASSQNSLIVIDGANHSFSNRKEAVCNEFKKWLMVTVW